MAMFVVMREVGLTFVADLSAERFEELVRAVADHHTLERVIRWSIARGLMVSDIIQQDEYTQDVVLPLDEGTLHLVYDCT